MSKTLSTMQRIQGLIYGKPRSLLEIRIELHRLTGEHFMDTSIAARIRELRSQGFDVKTETVKREGKTAVYRYSIPNTSLNRLAKKSLQSLET